ncbi:protein ABHD13-like isoform X2 [Mya arenaria]|uniref:protein ABHD13-like isoform X2 n=1 Tax=Mya arenaria TaxID=6604 RepID=UPI0022E02D6D|nr:protein ABHD13-like isoform X2 [Mya arenaria]
MTEKKSKLNKDQIQQENETVLIEKMSRSALYRTCQIVCRLAHMIIARFWKLCSSACLVILLVYWFYGGALSLLFLMISVFGIFYYAQDMFLYYPSQPPNSRIFVEQPDRFKLPFDNVFVKTKDGVSLNMYFITQQSFGYPTILMLHGNAGNIGHRLSMAYCLYKVCHCNILMVEYRGYGKSSGSPSESGLYIDARTALEWLLTKPGVDRKKIFVFGSSLGGAVSIQLASDPRYSPDIAGLILENTFTSLPDVAQSLININILDFLPTFCHKNQYFSDTRILKVTSPTLFLSGQRDELIPPRMMQALYNISGSKNKRLVPFEKGTHNDTCLCPRYYETIAEFVYQVINQPMKKPETTEVPMEIPDSSVI